jgi:heme-degrading monooxygenase HmoA
MYKTKLSTTWQSEEHLNVWLADPDYKEHNEQLQKVLMEKPTYRVLKQPKEDVFLL